MKKRRDRRQRENRDILVEMEEWNEGLTAEVSAMMSSRII